MFKTFLLTIVIVVAFMAAWELYIRGRGFSPTYNDDKILWANKRKEAYKSPERSNGLYWTVQGLKFDLDLPTWRKLTGEDAIQLAIVGTSPRPMLRDLGNDANFKGKVIVDMMEPLFYNPATFITEKSALEALKYYESETPAQRASALLGFKLESSVAFLEEGKFGTVPICSMIFSFPTDRESSASPAFPMNSQLQLMIGKPL